MRDGFNEEDRFNFHLYLSSAIDGIGEAETSAEMVPGTVVQNTRGPA
jgi:hypothetical protein